MSGISDVAKLAGVGKATASRALTGRGYVSEPTKVRVEEAARTLGYVPSTSAVSLATGRTQNIGVLMPYVTRWFFAEVLEGIQAALIERGLDLTLYDANPTSAGRRQIFEHYLARKRFDGLIAVGLEPELEELPLLMAIGKPVVGVVGEGSETSVIEIDDHNAARRATDHLITLGHRRIAFVGGGAEDFWAHVDRRRLEGYRQAMATAGLAHEATHTPSRISLPGGYAAAVDLLGTSEGRPTAVVAVCDEVAVGAIIAARRLGISVPADLSVVGIDDHEYAETFALTTLEQKPRQQGVKAVELLMSEIADPSRAPVHITLQPRLIVRASTAPPRGMGSVIRTDSTFDA
ncbi:LacI family DNA-binding transcriptional regulator [Glaciibacter flavus]|uniref:LacI family DNA-binding transcriptional regulator n=1 Tax=Orlajensenia flava TaxID=2565934 RepID=UPI003B003D80